MSINVEVLGGNPMVQHYVEEIAEPHHLRLVSNSDIFTPAGRVKGRGDLGLEREEDRRQYMRVHQCGAQLLHAGAPGLSGQTGNSMGGLPSRSQACFRGSQPAGDASLRQKYRTSRLKEKVILLVDARIQQI